MPFSSSLDTDADAIPSIVFLPIDYPNVALPQVSVPRRERNVSSYLCLLTMMFLHIHGGGCYICIRVSEIMNLLLRARQQ